MSRSRSKKQPPARSRKDSIRCRLGYVGGPWTIEQTREMILAALDELAATGIRHIARANLYLNPVDEKGRPVTRLDRYRPLPDIDVPHPYRSAAEEHGL
jgi:hypothetical protein